MRGYNICFHSEIRKIIFELSSIHTLIWSSGNSAGMTFSVISFVISGPLNSAKMTFSAISFVNSGPLN